MKRSWRAILAAALLAPGPATALDDLGFVVEGGTEEMAEALEGASLLVAADRDGVDDPTELLAAARADYARLVGALYAQGHYGGIVRIRIDGQEAASLGPFDAPARIRRIVVRVIPGPAYRFSRARVAPLAFETELPDGFAEGEIAEARVMREAVAASVERWREIGHAKAELEGQRIVADHAGRTIDAMIRMDPGPELRFGELRIEGETRVSDRRVRKIAGLPTGERFSPAELERSARRLRNTGVFRTAALFEAETANADGTLDIVAQVEDQKPRRFGFGAEYEADAGVTLSAFWLHRNIDGEALRFRIGGEIAGLAGDTGGEDLTLTTDLTRPASFGANTDAFIRLELESLNEPDFSSDGASLEFGILRRASDVMTYRAGVRFAWSEETDQTGDSEFQHIFFPIGATRDKRDSLLDTLDGHYVDVEVAPFFGLSDSEDGALLTLDARGYEDFGPNQGVVLAARLQAGSILGASVTGVPNDLRFYSGGGGTVRGQEYESLGIVLPGGIESGGRSFLGLQTEIRARVSDKIWAVGFYDWGMIGEGSTPGSDGEDHAGAGFGIRYETGIGPIRADIGFPVGGDDTDGGLQLYIGVGQAF